jgi:hypothetical protein
MEMSQWHTFYSYLRQKCLFFKNREQEGKTGAAWGAGLEPVGGGGIRKGHRRVSVVEIYTHV